MTPTLVGVEEYEIANQVGVSHHWWVIDGHLETFATPRRYVWPSELDLMARLAGLSLRERRRRTGTVAGSPVRRFARDSRSYISIGEKPTQAPLRSRKYAAQIWQHLIAEWCSAAAQPGTLDT